LNYIEIYTATADIWLQVCQFGIFYLGKKARNWGANYKSTAEWFYKRLACDVPDNSFSCI